jgi:hypothetical protein
MWPSSVGGGYPGGFPDTFDPSLLAVADATTPRPNATDVQYYRANVEPTDRYVVSLRGSTKHRLPAGKSGFTNLFLAGDWTLNGLNYGCVEAATMSGMQASRAICGYPKIIFGDNYPLPPD